MDTIQLPIKFDKGRVAVIEEFTRPFYSQVIALACRIEKGELPLELTYGVKDSTFIEFRETELRYVIGQFWPEVRLTTIRQKQPNSKGEIVLVVDFVHEG